MQSRKISLVREKRGKKTLACFLQNPISQMDGGLGERNCKMPRYRVQESPKFCGGNYVYDGNFDSGRRMAVSFRLTHLMQSDPSDMSVLHCPPKR